MQKSFQVAGARDIDLFVTRMAGRLAAELGAELHLVGIRRRGAPLARMLYDTLTARSGPTVSLGELTLKRYDDELGVLHEDPALEADGAQLPVAGKPVVLVDDVLYSGRTLLRATQCVMDQGARSVYCAVLCARNSQEVPIRVDFVGLQLDVGSRGIVDVEMPPYEASPGIILRHRE